MSHQWNKQYPSIQASELGEDHSLKKMLRLTGPNKRVIDFGCATGYLAQLLSHQGCTVTGVEVNPEAAKVAEQFCEQVVVANLDSVALEELFPDQKFDVAIFGDVLEHLRNPWEVLRKTRQLLQPEGYVVASIPNVAHGTIRLALLQGRFEYTEFGILDNTHLRFFTCKTVETLFRDSGYFIDTIERTTLPIFSPSSLVPEIDRRDFSPEVVQQIEQAEDTDTLQFVVQAFSVSQDGKYAALHGRYSQLSQQYEELQVQLHDTQLTHQLTQQHAENLASQLETARANLQLAQQDVENVTSQLEAARSEAANNVAPRSKLAEAVENFVLPLSQLIDRYKRH